MADSFEFKSPCNVFQFTDPEDSWETWNGLRGPAGPAGPPGSGVQLRGPVPSVEDLPTTAPSGELWLVGAASPYDGWFYNGSSWQDAGQIAVGPAGPAGTDGSDGTTFTPSVSAAGVISWTNDGGKANPDPVNIKGPQGDPGSAGAPGAPGSDGTTFTPSVSSAGVISWTNDGGKANPDPVNIKGPQGDTGPAGPGVPAGGSAGQVLAKTSGSDYATGWITPEANGWRLLWENPNKGSNFNHPQTISIPGLGNYQEVMIMVRQSTAASLDVTNLFLFQDGLKFQLFAFVMNPVRRTEIYFRTNGIEFSSTGNGAIMNTFGNYTSGGQYCIPTYIYAK